MNVPKSLYGRKKHLDRFRRSDSGEYVYCGNLFAYSDKEITRRRTLTSYWVSALFTLAAAIAQGFLPADGMLNCVYVILPFIAGLLCAVSSVWALVKLSTSKEPLREYVFASTVQALPVRAVFTLAFAGLSLMGECIFLATHEISDLSMSLLLLALMTTEAASALLLRRQTIVCRWTLMECPE